MKSSGIFTLVTKDWIKGFIMAVIGAVIGLIQGMIDAGTFTFNWTDIGRAALIAGVGYIAKNLMTNNKDQLLKKDVPTS